MIQSLLYRLIYLVVSAPVVHYFFNVDSGIATGAEEIEQEFIFIIVSVAVIFAIAWIPGILEMIYSRQRKEIETLFEKNNIEAPPWAVPHVCLTLYIATLALAIQYPFVGWIIWIITIVYSEIYYYKKREAINLLAHALSE